MPAESGRRLEGGWHLGGAGPELGVQQGPGPWDRDKGSPTFPSNFSTISFTNFKTRAYCCPTRLLPTLCCPQADLSHTAHQTKSCGGVPVRKIPSRTSTFRAVVPQGRDGAHGSVCSVSSEWAALASGPTSAAD